MTSEGQSRRPRTVLIADVLWDAYEAMSRELGTERDGLVAQALFAFARNNGFLEAPRLAAAREHPSTGLTPLPATVPVPVDPVPTEVMGERGRELERVGGAREAGRAQLYLISSTGEPERIRKGRYVIGRGRHCDLVIGSGKVSREHAAIFQEGGGYVIEDLGSSNGTWFEKQRIQRRRIDDGDEYYICNEKIKLVLR